MMNKYYINLSIASNYQMQLHIGVIKPSMHYVDNIHHVMNNDEYVLQHNLKNHVVKNKYHKVVTH